MVAFREPLYSVTGKQDERQGIRHLTCTTSDCGAVGDGHPLSWQQYWAQSHRPLNHGFMGHVLLVYQLRLCSGHKRKVSNCPLSDTHTLSRDKGEGPLVKNQDCWLVCLL